MEKIKAFIGLCEERASIQVIDGELFSTDSKLDKITDQIKGMSNELGIVACRRFKDQYHIQFTGMENFKKHVTGTIITEDTGCMEHFDFKRYIAYQDDVVLICVEIQRNEHKKAQAI